MRHSLSVHRVYAILSATCIAALPLHPVHGREGGSKAIGNLLACRDIADATARLACFDREITGLSAATETEQAGAGDPVAQAAASSHSTTDMARRDMDRERTRARQNSEDRPKQFDAKIKDMRLAPTGDRWRFTLEDGSVWETFDVSGLLEPGAIAAVTLKRAAFNTYFARFHGGPTLRCQKIR